MRMLSIIGISAPLNRIRAAGAAALQVAAARERGGAQGAPADESLRASARRRRAHADCNGGRAGEAHHRAALAPP